MDLFLQISGVLVYPVLFALISWIAGIARDLVTLRLHVAEKYVSREVLEGAIEPILEDVEFLKRILTRVAAKMKVSVK